TMDFFAAVAMTELSRSITDRRLERQRGVPRKEHPGVLRYFGNERIDQWPALRLGVDGGKMRVRHHVAHQPSGLAGIDEVVDDQEPVAGPAAERCGIGRNAL